MGFKMVTEDMEILNLTYQVKLLKWMTRKSGGKQAASVHLLLVADDALNAKD